MFDDISRKNELRNFLLSNSINDVTENDLSELVRLEQKMSENRGSLLSLMDAEVMDEIEVEKKIEICFHVFLKQVVKLLGNEKCKALYDFLPGETLTFLATDEQTVFEPQRKAEVAVVHSEQYKKATRQLREARQLKSRIEAVEAAKREQSRSPGYRFITAEIQRELEIQDKVETGINKEELAKNLKYLIEALQKAKVPVKASLRAEQKLRRSGQPLGKKAVSGFKY